MKQAVDYVSEALACAGFDCSLDDLGEGCLQLLATRGSAGTLVNCHLDTVPPASGWMSNPHKLEIEDAHAIGLGACDIKGAAACILAAAGATQGDAAVLFTTDEEAGQSLCVRRFLDGEHARSRFERAIVCEPTECHVVCEHRSLHSIEASFHGVSAHSSSGVASTMSAVHNAIRWSAGALEWSESTCGDSRISIGVIEGGRKPNMVAESATLRFGVRSRAGVSSEEMLQQLRALPYGSDIEWTSRFFGPSLLPGDHVRVIAKILDVQCAPPVDFWTEAALFAEHGIPSVVFGPGSITWAHAAGERISLAQLDKATTSFRRLFSRSKDSTP